jgi:heme exporter protein D
MGGPHTGFIVAAYAVALVVVLGMIAGVVLDHRAQQRALARLERPADDAAP